MDGEIHVSQLRFSRRRRGHIDDREVFVPTVEDVVVTKLRWALRDKRPKDLQDLNDVIATQQQIIDWDYVYRWCDVHGTRALLDEIRASIPKI